MLNTDIEYNSLNNCLQIINPQEINMDTLQELIARMADNPEKSQPQAEPADDEFNFDGDGDDKGELDKGEFDKGEFDKMQPDDSGEEKDPTDIDDRVDALEHMVSKLLFKLTQIIGQKSVGDDAEQDTDGEYPGDDDDDDMPAPDGEEPNQDDVMSDSVEEPTTQDDAGEYLKAAMLFGQKNPESSFDDMVDYFKK